MPRSIKPPTPSANGHAKGAPRNRISTALAESVTAKEGKPFQRLYETLGVTFDSESNGEAIAGCPFCDREGHFYVNIETGLFDCKVCGESGNALVFVRSHYENCLASTSDDDYSRLKKLRGGMPLQTLKRWRCAWDGAAGCWLIPVFNKNGEVTTLTRYYESDRRKLNLPGLPTGLYGLDQLSDDASRPVYMCEGVWDGMALDYYLHRAKIRDRFDILAVPGATTFKPAWAALLAGREVRFVFDNDDAGRKGQQRAVKIIQDAKVGAKIIVLNWPEGTPDKYDIGDFVKSHIQENKSGLVKFISANSEVVAATTSNLIFTTGNAITETRTEWLTPGRMQFGTFVSLAGLMGTHKSGIARYIAACATAGLKMFKSKTSIAPFDVIYFTSEDSAQTVCDLVAVEGGDLNRLHIHDIATTDDPIDLLDCLGEIEAEINARGVRLVILDALNSFVGGEISTDSKARRSLSGRLQSLARRTGACIIGLRNWGRSPFGTSSQKTLGATSLSDVARCVLNTKELPPKEGEPRAFALEWEKLSDAPKPLPLMFTITDLSTGPDNLHLRRIEWGISREEAEKIVADLEKSHEGKGGANG